MKKNARKDGIGSSRKGVLILLCALAPIAIGLLLPNREEKAEAPAQVQPPAPAFESTGQADDLDHPNPGVDLARFDARARAKQRDALRELNDAKSRLNTDRRQWADLLKRHAAGDKEAFDALLDSITTENALEVWELAKGSRISRADKGRLYEALGMAGGGELFRHLIGSADRDAALAVKGWSQIDPAGAFDWFRQLDVNKNPEMQQYLAAASLDEHAFLDGVSDGLLDSLESQDSGAAFAEAATQLVESLMGEDPMKGEAMMREVTERFVDLYDSSALTEWFNQIDDPNVQSAAIQRIIETGAFKDNPFQAVEVAMSLDNSKSRQTALSAAFGQLGGGAGGVDPNSVAAQLNQMPPGRDRDFAINGFAHGLVGKSPESALQWADSISDDGFRQTVTRNLNRRIGAQGSSGEN